MTPRPPRRNGYTLLEVLIASVIGLLLMGAVYAAFSLIVNSTNTGRDLTAESDLTRGIINRFAIDLGSPVGVLPPKSGGTPPAAVTAGTSTSTDPAAAAPTTTGTAATDAPIPFQAGVVGTSDVLIIFISRTPDAIRKKTGDLTAVGPGDVVKVTYYMGSGGLCRQERPWVTSDPVWGSRQPDLSTEATDVIAPEVSKVVFEYASGAGYQSQWDGTIGGTDGATNQGPPRAVKVTFTLKLLDKDGIEVLKDVAHVFPIRASAGTNTGASTPATGSTGTGSATTGTGG